MKTCHCPNKKCKRHGDCAACKKNHGNKNMYCNLPEKSFRKWIVNTLFRVK
ncbi:MAG: hypothetical protein FWB80_09560 [Defluviitaleaceae bacterium]|nr:hypothetical protein [Defluviitaleaceae bacterium]